MIQPHRASASSAGGTVYSESIVIDSTPARPVTTKARPSARTSIKGRWTNSTTRCSQRLPSARSARRLSTRSSRRRARCSRRLRYQTARTNSSTSLRRSNRNGRGSRKRSRWEPAPFRRWSQRWRMTDEKRRAPLTRLERARETGQRPAWREVGRRLRGESLRVALAAHRGRGEGAPGVSPTARGSDSIHPGRRARLPGHPVPRTG
jgi:hypothetical protein